jgi:GYF domain 2
LVSALNDPVWYISRNDQRLGPFSADQFARFEEAGTLRPTDQIWQTGMEAWIEYSDYVASKSRFRSEGPHQPSSSVKADDEKCAICLMMRRGIRAVTTTLTTAFHGVSTFLAKKSSVRAPSRAAGISAHAPEGTIRPPVDLYPASIRPSLLGANEPSMRIANGLPPQQIKQDQDPNTPDVGTESLAQALPVLSSSTPRLVSEVEASVQIGLDLATFRAWVAAGRLPHALPDCGKYDMKAIHLALDRISGIVSRENG